MSTVLTKLHTQLNSTQLYCNILTAEQQLETTFHKFCDILLHIIFNEYTFLIVNGSNTAAWSPMPIPNDMRPNDKASCFNIARTTRLRSIKPISKPILNVGMFTSRRRGSGRSVIDIDFPMAILAYFFSCRRIASKQRYCHIRQTICSTRFGVRVCLLVVWCKNF